jgi:hypothetical protein
VVVCLLPVPLFQLIEFVVMSLVNRIEFEDVAAVGQEAAEEVPIAVAVAESAAQVTGVVSKVTVLKLKFALFILFLFLDH